MSTGNKMIDSALEAGNFSLALKLADKKIQQQPNSSHNHACRCYILAKAAMCPESTTTADSVLSECVELSNKIPSDPNTLNLLDSAFQLLDYTPKDDLYEAAVRKYSSTNLVYDWFKRTVDKNDIVGMQKASMALSKVFKSNTENGRMVKLWAAASMYIVIECCKDKDRLSGNKDKLLAMLGLKILEGVEGDSKNGLNAQEMFVKCQLLLKKGDNDECLRELEDFISKENNLDLLLIYFDQLKENERWSELYDACVNYLINVGVDDWDTWKLAILAARNLGKMDQMNEVISSYKIGRNSQLAKIEAIEAGDTSGKEKTLENYLSLYMHKLCCYLDLECFLEENLFMKTSILSILDKQFSLKDLDSVVRGDRKATDNDLVLLVNYIKIKTKLFPELFEDKEFFSICCQYYNSTKHLQNKLVDFDYYCGFEFIILALESYLTINRDSTNTQSFFNLIIILENSLIRNKYEFHLQLWLAHCYSHTNLSSPLKRIFEALKIKNVQIDTLGPHFMNHLSSKTRNSDLISTAARFYSHNVAMELPPMVMSCFEHCTFSKLKGFIEFKLRTENSITHYQVVLESIQNFRLNKENMAINDIVTDFIPSLKDAFNVMKCSSNDIDLKLHDNIDRKIMWQCGDHKIHEIPQNIVESNFGAIFDAKYVEILTLRELIIYEQCSRIWEDYRKRYLELVNNKKNLTNFSKIEKYVLSVFTWLLNSTDKSSMPQIPDAPTDVLSAECNNYYLSLIDLECILRTVNARSGSQTFFGNKHKRSQITKVHNYIRDMCRKIPRDELLISTKESVKKARELSQDWFANDEFGKQFKIEADIVNRCYKNIEQDALKAIKEI